MWERREEKKRVDDRYDYDFICTLCGLRFDNQVDGFRVLPRECPRCEAPRTDLMEAEEYETSEQIIIDSR